MRSEDSVRIRHMLDAAREAVGFAEGRKRADLDGDRMLVHALVRCIEVLGEAASRVSEPAQSKHGGVPWKDIIGMRNRLIHAYFDVDHDRVWDTVTDDLPPLIQSLEFIVEGGAGR